MIRLTLTLDSLVLHEPITIQVAMPQLLNFNNVKLKCVYGLHCLCSDSDLFFRRLNVEDYVEKYNCAFISTSLGNSFYLNSRLNNVADFLDFEFFPYLKSLLPLSDKKEDNFCLGVSMGAFGTLAWALRKQDYFSKVACISGYYDFSLGMSDDLKKQRNAYILAKLSRPYMMEAFSEGSLSTGIIKKETNAELIGYGCYQESANLIKLIESAKDHGVDVDLYCGDNDQISLEQSKFFFKHLKEHGFYITYTEVEGVHDVYAWRKALVLAFDKFFDNK